LALAGCGTQPVELLNVSQQPAAPSGETVLGTPPEAALARLRAQPDELGDEGIELLYPAPPELVVPADLAPIDFAWMLGPAPKPPPPPMPAPVAGMPAPPPPDPMKDKDKPPAAAADPVLAYELRASGPSAVAHLYLDAQGGAFPRGDWSALLRQHIGQNLQITLRGVRASGRFSHARSLSLQVRPPLPAGTFYAFSTTARGLMRGELSRTHQELVVPQGAQDWGCTGCHTVSSDGKRMLAAVGSGASLRSWQRGSSAAPLRIEPSEAGAGYAFASFDRSATRIARIQGGRLSIFDADSGSVLDQSPAPLRAAVEALDWSPDSRTLVLVLQGDKPEPDAARGGSLASVSVAFDGRLSEPVPLYTAPKDEMLLWPCFSPDGAYIAFEKRKGATRDAREGKLFLLRAEGGEPIELLALRDKPMASASAPAFVQGSVPERPYLVFSSRRPVGSFQPAEGQRQLFASALDLSLADTGKDPSHAAFWLPFQQRTSSYLRAQWAPEPRECTAYAELCDDVDDDCDGNVDEDCCRPAAAESCDNQQDDDCDGAVEEGCSCSPRELCANQRDDDCDLRTDEQPCMPAPPGK
jgi:hypothetical protein